MEDKEGSEKLLEDNHYFFQFSNASGAEIARFTVLKMSFCTRMHLTEIVTVFT